ncbi:HD domain-containing protein [Flavobacterium sp.]|uniref:HD domain-containing protein n=1 Tax=Flavobacterium sp. TaxID=239 RepID=UPI002B4AE348|nr:HD domain-containing protein [Flavobacterium sp.]HLP64686.1 HD domain-containing protein [Flavobacterium sp.]
MEKHAIIDSLLCPFKPIIGEDYNRYRNHVCRVFSNCLYLDNQKEHVEKYAIAAVYHDIGIWTDDTIDYLQPSIAQAKLYLTKIGKSHWNEEVSKMIDWHHKINVYQENDFETVEIFRKADWTDVSLGVLSHGIPKQLLNTDKKQFPNLGFHWFLIKKILANLTKHPLNPLPMFKK